MQETEPKEVNKSRFSVWGASLNVWGKPERERSGEPVLIQPSSYLLSNLPCLINQPELFIQPPLHMI